jgi:hypothetical protein
MGLKKGEKIQQLCGPIKILSVRHEPLMSITGQDVTWEGFPEFSRCDFIEMLRKHYGANRIRLESMVNRIMFTYTEYPDPFNPHVVCPHCDTPWPLNAIGMTMDCEPDDRFGRVKWTCPLCEMVVHDGDGDDT